MCAPPEHAAPPEAEETAPGPAGDDPADAVVAGPAEDAGPPPEPVTVTAEAVRIAEALLFASDRPVQPARLQQVLPEGQQAAAVLAALGAALDGRGVILAEVAGGFAFRTAPDLAPALTRVVEVPRRLPRVAMETLAVIAWHQPVTRAEVEEIRGAGLSQATLEALLEHGLIAPKGHKEVPGRPTLWGTTQRFLEQFGLTSLRDLPKREELVSAEAAAPLLSAAEAAAASAEDAAAEDAGAGEAEPEAQQDEPAEAEGTAGPASAQTPAR
ncbi:SMC-Scp complex subunit ScpB [Falsiroseomonas oryziterrae]|uniref:SMC-Scp complex subunit ScpB n=1 Tax=Falsiroseomonas oryziterrae TaxID=2911368 RepID=UPI001F01B558|nr:SMC-Scp complex subunit ScpB [Roseomonas sp. NPKOSM-4]